MAGDIRVQEDRHPEVATVTGPEAMAAEMAVGRPDRARREGTAAAAVADVGLAVAAMGRDAAARVLR